MNWGGFAAGLGVGINSGLKLGQAWNDASKQKKLEDIRAQGIAEANQARASAVSGMINDTGSSSEKQDGNSVATTKPVTDAKVEQKPLSDIKPTATPTTTAQTTPASTGDSTTPAADKPAIVSPQATAQVAASGIQPSQPDGRFVVGNKRFSTREEAQAEANKRVAPIENFVTDNILKKQQQFYVESGDVEKAAQLGKYIESTQGQRAVKTYGNAMTALMAGDIDNGVKHLGEYYNQNVDDGVDFVGHSITPEGNIAITLRKKDGGGESQMVMSKRDLLMLGFAHDPVKLQAQLLDAQTAKDKAANEMAKEDRAAKREDYRDVRNFRQQKELKAIENQNAIERDNMRPGDLGRKIKDAQESGLFTDDEIKSMAKGAASDVGKAPHPETIRLQVYNKLAEDGNKFAKYKIQGEDGKVVEKSFGDMNTNERRRLVDEQTSAIMSSTRGPVTGGLPPIQQPEAPKMRPMVNTKTGKMEMVPVR